MLSEYKNFKKKSIYLYTLSVGLYQMNNKTAEPIGPKLLWHLTLKSAKI